MLPEHYVLSEELLVEGAPAPEVPAPAPTVQSDQPPLVNYREKAKADLKAFGDAAQEVIDAAVFKALTEPDSLFD